MISPKYALTHYYHPSKIFSNSQSLPNIINLYLDYNCPFSGKLFTKLRKEVIPQLQDKNPGKFQFVFVNVIQPWHPNSVLLNEFSLVLARKLREKTPQDSNEKFWEVSQVIFDNKEVFYDNANVTLDRNAIYEQISEVVFSNVKLPFKKEDVLEELKIKPAKDSSEYSNSGNGATTDVKYFTKYLRGVGVHVTPTVSVNGIVDDSISSGLEPAKLREIFESHL